MITIRRSLPVAAAAAALLAFSAPAARAETVLSVFGGRVPCVLQLGVQFCAGTVATRVESFDGVPLDVNVTLPPASMTGPFPLIVDIHGWGVGKSPDPMVERANAGFVVLSYSARGFHQSCGFPASRVPDPTLSDPMACLDRGWIRMGDARYEVRDTQFLAGLLADEGLVIPNRVGVTGSSYGGGQSMMLAALRNRVLLPDGTLAPWKSPGGLDMEIAAAAPIIPWSDLSFSLVPNGRTLDYRSFNPYGTRGGVLKQSYVNLLFNLGLAVGFYSAPGTDPDADIQGWKARLDEGEPYDDDPYIVDALNEVSTHHSAYYIDDSIPPAPLFLYNAWTDDLFPATEALRFYNKTRALHPQAEVTMMFADAFGHPRASLGGDMSRISASVDDLFARHLQGAGGDALPTVVTYTQACGGAAEEGPFEFASWEEAHPGEVRLTSLVPQSFDSAGGDPLNATLVDPAGAGSSCRVGPDADDAGAATYRLPAATGDGYTLMGSPTVIAALEATGDYPQVAARLWDVAGDGSQLLVSQGFYRPRNDGASPDVFQLPANGWHFAAGHVAKLELLGQSSPFGRASNGTFEIEVSSLELRLPVLEQPDGVVVLEPAPPVLPEGIEAPACATEARTSCAQADSSKLLVRGGEKPKLVWKWKGEVDPGALGDPTVATGYALCVYDGDGTLVSTLGAGAASTCDGKPCWRATGSGFRYRGSEDDEIARLDLKAGGVGVVAAGDEVPMLPFEPLPATVQLTNSDGACWEVTYDTVQRNDENVLRAR